MAATGRAAGPAADATGVGIDFAVLEARCRELGATSLNACAELVDVDRATLWRYKTGRFRPRMETAQQIARRLGITLDELCGAGRRAA